MTDDQGAAPDEPIASGTFVVWPDGDGGFVLVVDTPAGGTTRRHFSRRLVKTVQKFAGGLFPPGIPRG